MTTIDRSRLAALTASESERYAAARPRSRALFERAARSLVGGVPMQWMSEWPGPFPPFMAEAEGARLTDIDGHRYIDFCLGDTGAMFGHSPPAVARVAAAQAAKGLTAMLPSENAVIVAELLAQRFALPFWQMALSATDANRFVLRLAREITGRPKILVFNGCYHGTVDETIVSLENGKPRSRRGNVGPAFDPTADTRVIEFNDLAALEAALADRKVACVLTEPALTNLTGVVLPDDGYHAALRAIARKTGTLLIIDETHTISTGPGGYSRAHGLEPDILVLGKPIAGGIPAAVFGMTDTIGGQVRERLYGPGAAVAGIGGTLTANALALAAMRATLTEVATEAAYDHMIRLGTRLAEGIRAVVRRHDLPWYVTQLGARVEYRFQPSPPRTGTEARAGADSAVDRFFHLWCLNRGVMVTPMHNMLLACPATSEADIDRHNEVFGEAVAALLGR
ncbi:MAG TPA: transaminase [Hypericibacter adhaerens]|uniref:transaminase n=1 Tax=Hypericibacter adhaerens TaxID=2602016 RepID=UPI002B69BFC4|nr:transaminase [Hypericibacter adhaerens]HWA44343.1 transaminase [Hypericibacter adhaerens]